MGAFFHGYRKCCQFLGRYFIFSVSVFLVPSKRAENCLKLRNAGRCIRAPVVNLSETPGRPHICCLFGLVHSGYMIRRQDNQRRLDFNNEQCLFSRLLNSKHYSQPMKNARTLHWKQTCAEKSICKSSLSTSLHYSSQEAPSERDHRVRILFCSRNHR